MFKHGIRLAIISAITLTPTVAPAIPVRPARAIEFVDYRIVFRSRPIDAEAPKVPFTATPTKEGFVLHKVQGPETIEALLGPKLSGDFTADIEVDIAGFGALGIRPNGGTPVPYFGFRGISGKDEIYFLLSTYGGGWHPLSIQIRREKTKVSAKLNGYVPSGGGRACAEPGFITFVMNDTSKIRVRRFDVRTHGPTPAFPLPK